MASSVPITLQARDKRTLLIVTGVALFWLFLLGFPLLDWDTGRYIKVLVEPLRQPSTAPSVQYLMLRPFALFLGPWTIPLLANIALMYVSVVSARAALGESRALPILFAFFASGAYIWTNFILVDVSFSVGLLAIYCLAMKAYPRPMLGLLVCCIVAHSANVCTLAPLSFVVFLVTRSWATLRAFILSLAGVWLIISMVAWILYGFFTPLAMYGSSNLVGRVIVDLPTSLPEYTTKYPESPLARHKDAFVEQRDSWEQRPDVKSRIPKWAFWTPERTPYVQSFRAINVTYKGKFPLTQWESEGFTKAEQRHFLIATFLNHPVAFTRVSCENVFLFLIGASLLGIDDWPYSYITDRTQNPAALVEQYAPQYAAQYENGLQAQCINSVQLRTLLFPNGLFCIAFCVALFVNAFVSINALLYRNVDRAILVLGLIIMSGTLLQAFVMANLSSMHGRYFTTVYFGVIFAGCLLLSHIARRNRLMGSIFTRCERLFEF